MSFCLEVIDCVGAGHVRDIFPGYRRGDCFNIVGAASAAKNGPSLLRG